MKKVTFAKNFDNSLDVLLSGKMCGILKFGNEEYGRQQGIWILWIENIEGTEGVSYFKDLQKTKDTIDNLLNCARKEIDTYIDNKGKRLL